MSASPRYSLKGFDYKKYLSGIVDLGKLVGLDKKSLMEIGKWALPIVLGIVKDLSPELLVPASLLGKAGLDILHYYLQDR